MREPIRSKFGRSYRYLVLTLSIVTSVAVIGSRSILQTHAAPNNSFSFSPASGSYTVGSTVTITVHETSTDNITAMEADFSYTSNLTYQSESFATSGFTSQPPGNGASGGIVTMQNAGTALTGDQIVGTVTFTVNAPGTATLAFQSSSQLVNGSGTNVLVPGASAPASYTLAAASSGGGGSSGGGSTGGGTGSGSSGGGGVPAAPPAKANSKSTSVSVAPKTSGSSPAVSPVTVPDNGSVEASDPVTVQPATVQPDGVKKVEYYLNGKLVDTETKSPYKYNIDTTQLKNGTYKLLSKTYYTNGTTKQTTQKLIVKNAAEHSANMTWLYLLIIGIILLLGLGVNFIGPSAGGPFRRLFGGGHHGGPAPAGWPTGGSASSMSGMASMAIPDATTPPVTSAASAPAPSIPPEDLSQTTTATRLSHLTPPHGPAPGTIFRPHGPS